MREMNQAEQFPLWGKFLEYTAKFDGFDSGVKLKIAHTWAVTENICLLCELLHLSFDQKRVAYACGVFHDIGRFEQLCRYNTLCDKASFDHGAFGADFLNGTDLLNDYSQREKELITTAIRNHNKLYVEEGLDTEESLYCHLVRDADKIDAFRVNCTQSYLNFFGVDRETLSCETISDSVVIAALEHRTAKYDEYQSHLDDLVGSLCFFFDMHFAESIKLAKERGFYRKALDCLCIKDEHTRRNLDIVLDTVEAFIADKIKGI